MITEFRCYSPWQPDIPKFRIVDHWHTSMMNPYNFTLTSHVTDSLIISRGSTLAFSYDREIKTKQPWQKSTKFPCSRSVVRRLMSGALSGIAFSMLMPNIYLRKFLDSTIAYRAHACPIIINRTKSVQLDPTNHSGTWYIYISAAQSALLKRCCCV